jgi:peptide/nickel transport system substrate-binding protein
MDQTQPNQPTEPTPLPPNQTPPQIESGSNWPKRIVFSLTVLLLISLAVLAALKATDDGTKSSQATVKKEVPLLRMGVEDPVPATFYPNIPDETLSFEVNEQMFEGLTKFQDKTKVVPGLATSWSNPNNTTWIFKLRQNVYFHTGRIMTASDVKASLDGAKSSDVGQIFATTIKTVEAVDSQTVKIITAQPDPLLTTELSFLWIFDAKGQPNDPANGTGPYNLKPGTKSSDKQIDLVAFDKYYGGRSMVRALEWQSFDDDQAVLAALQAHKLEMGFFGDGTYAGKAGAGFQTYNPNGLAVAFLIPNTQRAGSPLQKLAVRQAMYEALDAQQLMKVRNINGRPATQLVPEEVPGYDPNIKRPTFDAAKAKADLVKAGYPNGLTLTFTYFTSAQNLATEIQKELAAIGIKLNLDVQTDGSKLAAKAFGGKTDLFYLTNRSDLIDTSDVLSSLVLGENYSSSKVSNLLNQANTTFGQAKRLKLLQQINDLIMSDVAVFPLYEINAANWAIPSNLVVSQQNFVGYSGLNFNQVYAK